MTRGYIVKAEEVPTRNGSYVPCRTLCTPANVKYSALRTSLFKQRCPLLSASSDAFLLILIRDEDVNQPCGIPS